ncbi:nucleotide sugar dehydrogenase [Chloroflexota bacterium]
MSQKIGNPKKISVIGLGHIGQTLSVSLAEGGFLVYGTDINKDVLAQIKKHETHWREPGLSELLSKHLNKNLFVGTPEETSDNEVDVFIVCVSFPASNTSSKETGSREDLKMVVKNIQPQLRPGQIVIMRTTVAVGTTRNFIKPLLEESGLNAGEDFGLVFAPERTIEGNAIKELGILPQIIGGINERSSKEADDIFRRLNPHIVHVSSLETAEMIKLMDNSYRDFRFAYANEIAKYCEEAGIDAFEAIRAANLNYPRNSIPVPSPGVGGHCLCKDSYLFLESAEEVGQKLELIAKAREINEAVPLRLVNRLKKQGSLANKKVFIAGFAFKGEPETNDMRNSPTVELVRHLFQEGSLIAGYDPTVEREKIESLNIQYSETLEEGLKDADIVIFMNNHKSFSNQQVSDKLSHMKPGGIVFDGWSLFSKDEIEKHGIRYMGIGVGERSSISG